MTTHEKLRQLTLTSLFIALVVLFGMTPLGLIPVGTLNATILHIPVIIGVIALGLKPGLILGLAFGLVSTLRAFGIPLQALRPSLRRESGRLDHQYRFLSWVDAGLLRLHGP